MMVLRKVEAALKPQKHRRCHSNFQQSKAGKSQVSRSQHGCRSQKCAKRRPSIDVLAISHQQALVFSVTHLSENNQESNYSSSSSSEPEEEKSKKFNMMNVLACNLCCNRKQTRQSSHICTILIIILDLLLIVRAIPAILSIHTLAYIMQKNKIKIGAKKPGISLQSIEMYRIWRVLTWMVLVVVLVTLFIMNSFAQIHFCNTYNSFVSQHIIHFFLICSLILVDLQLCIILGKTEVIARNVQSRERRRIKQRALSQRTNKGCVRLDTPTPHSLEAGSTLLNRSINQGVTEKIHPVTLFPPREKTSRVIPLNTQSCNAPSSRGPRSFSNVPPSEISRGKMKPPKSQLFRKESPRTARSTHLRRFNTQTINGGRESTNKKQQSIGTPFAFSSPREENNQQSIYSHRHDDQPFEIQVDRESSDQDSSGKQCSCERSNSPLSDVIKVVSCKSGTSKYYKSQLSRLSRKHHSTCGRERKSVGEPVQISDSQSENDAAAGVYSQFDFSHHGREVKSEWAGRH